MVAVSECTLLMLGVANVEEGKNHGVLAKVQEMGNTFQKHLKNVNETGWVAFGEKPSTPYGKMPSC